MTGELITYAEFRQQYDEQHPASIPVYEPPIADNPYWMAHATLAMFICAAVLSGVHTVPTAYITIEAGKVAEWVRQVAALGAFIFVEVGILLTSYAMFKKWSWIAFLILIFSIGIAIIANLYSVFQAMRTNDMGAMAVGVALGIGAPLIAMMSGKQYVNIHRSAQIAELRARQKFRDDNMRHDADIQEGWDALQAKNEAKAERAAEQERIRIEREAEQVHTLNSLNGANERLQLPYSANSSSGYTKRMDAKTVIREFLEQNPDALNSKLNDLVIQIESISGVKVGRTSVHNVRREILQEQSQ